MVFGLGEWTNIQVRGEDLSMAGGLLDRGPFRCDPERGQREVAGEVSVPDFEGMVLEVAFGAVEADRCVGTQPDSWDLLACGLLNPISGSDESEDNDFELLVRHLLLDTHCSFRVRASNLDRVLDWSRSSPKLSSHICHLRTL